MKEKIIIYEVQNGAFLPRRITIAELTKRVNSNNLITKYGASNFFLRKHEAYNHINKEKGYDD